ncbi:MAG: hypothetical protein NWF05_09970 [Candidatus Bathyarchaeota archaeon]|nr:hypothetical protein [Candidatus Bathyarchaeota archaeon]
MESEFEKQLNTLQLDAAAKTKIMQIVQFAGEEFPCVSCPSKDECNSFNWFSKWFGEKSSEK